MGSIPAHKDLKKKNHIHKAYHNTTHKKECSSIGSDNGPHQPTLCFREEEELACVVVGNTICHRQHPGQGAAAGLAENHFQDLSTFGQGNGEHGFL